MHRTAHAAKAGSSPRQSQLTGSARARSVRWCSQRVAGALESQREKIGFSGSFNTPSTTSRRFEARTSCQGSKNEVPAGQFRQLVISAAELVAIAKILGQFEFWQKG
jgi:hypothetical protein